MSELTSGVVAVPATLLVMAAVAGATAQVTQADPSSVRRSVYTTGAVLIGASMVSQNTNVIVATVVAVAATVFIVKPLWIAPS